MYCTYKNTDHHPRIIINLLNHNHQYFSFLKIDFPLLNLFINSIFYYLTYVNII